MDPQTEYVKRNFWVDHTSDKIAWSSEFPVISGTLNLPFTNAHRLQAPCYQPVSADCQQYLCELVITISLPRLYIFIRRYSLYLVCCWRDLKPRLSPRNLSRILGLT